MLEHTFLSYLNNIDWRAAFQWYLNHLDVAHLIWTWQQDKAFSDDDWMSIMVLVASYLVLLFLVNLIIKKYREIKFHRWLEAKRSQLINSRKERRENFTGPVL